MYFNRWNVIHWQEQIRVWAREGGNPWSPQLDCSKQDNAILFSLLYFFVPGCCVLSIQSPRARCKRGSLQMAGQRPNDCSVQRKPKEIQLPVVIKHTLCRRPEDCVTPQRSSTHSDAFHLSHTLYLSLLSSLKKHRSYNLSYNQDPNNCDQLLSRIDATLWSLFFPNQCTTGNAIIIVERAIIIWHLPTHGFPVSFVQINISASEVNVLYVVGDSYAYWLQYHWMVYIKRARRHIQSWMIQTGSQPPPVTSRCSVYQYLTLPTRRLAIAGKPTERAVLAKISSGLTGVKTSDTGVTV